MSRIEDALAKANQLRNSNINDRMDPEPAPPLPIGLRKGNSRWRYGVGVSIGLAVCFGLYRHAEVVMTPLRPELAAAEIAGKPRPAMQQPAPVESSTQKTRLPTAIPLKSLDTAYSTAHPGWQRYVTESLEFRVFREKSTVKAIQVLSRPENAITADLFASFLGEISGGKSFKVQSGEDKDGYYMEKGAAGDMANVVVYRTKPAGEIKAFVVAYL